MPRRDAPRDLLVGLLALQNGMVTKAQLVAACAGWTSSPGRSLADLLVEGDALDPAGRDLLLALAERQLRAHGDDPESSLPALDVPRSTRESLAAAAPDFEATIAHLGSGSNGDSDRTSTYVGTATADGQRFRVLRPHAQGGLGAVSVALDTELHREVALKQILDRHADDPASRARFLLEAEITGGLEHPGIVPVYGLGADGDGRPYYAMRFIRGDSLKEAIERLHADASLKADPGRRSLELRKLLRRFLDVCNAIGYAHSRGVLHRDLKPANILVGPYGETLIVDWGLAKATGRVEPGPGAGDRALVPSSGSGLGETLPGSALGTPAYMSPEQAAGDLRRLGPPSDVYSLGATLYCLLTGRTPFEGDVAAILGAVRRGAFPAPRTLDPALDRATEAICLKAMALAPEDRYATPRELAEDVDRWLADEPVLAYREGAAQRMARWLRQHREWARAGLAALVLIASVSAGAVLAIDGARRGERTARRRTTEALTAERAARGEAEENFQAARRAVQDYLTTVSESTLLKQQDRADLRDLRKRLLEGALAYFQAFIAQHADDARRQAELADAYERVGSITSEIGSKEEALRSYERALAIRRRLADRDPSARLPRRDLAWDHDAIGKLQRETGRITEAERSLGRARDLRRGLVAEDPSSAESASDLAVSLDNLGVLLAATDRAAEALKCLEQAREIRERLADSHPGEVRFQAGLADSIQIKGRLYDDIGRPAEALGAYSQALAIRRRLAEARPADPEVQHSLACADLDLGMLQRAVGRFDEARASYEEALEIQTRLAEAHPSVTEYQTDLARMHNSMGLLRRSTDHPAEALESFERSLEIHRRLAEANPSVTSFQSRVASTHFNIGLLHHDSDRTAEALRSYGEALAIYRKLVAAAPSVTEFRNNLASTLKSVGLQQRQSGQPEEARRSLGQALAIWEELGDPSGLRLYQRASALAQLSDLAEPGRGPAIADEAMRTLRRAIAAGFRDPFSYQGDINLDPLRPRPDFQRMVMDLLFPDDPFAH
jgi:serine/threonine-protein kinase